MELKGHRLRPVDCRGAQIQVLRVRKKRKSNAGSSACALLESSPPSVGVCSSNASDSGAFELLALPVLELPPALPPTLPPTLPTSGSSGA